MPKCLDLTEQRFGRLLAIEPAEHHIRTNGGIRTRWLCRCDCGNTVIVCTSDLKSGATQSCKCLHRELLALARTTHGQAKTKRQTKTYRSWVAMVSRCTNPNTILWHRYGGRGIEVCERWKSFDDFFADMGERPRGYSLDRIDNDGHYCKENCRWATTREQRRNTSRTRLITYQGRTQCLTDWATELGWSCSTLGGRLSRADWSMEKVIAKSIKVQQRSGRDV